MREAVVSNADNLVLAGYSRSLRMYSAIFKVKNCPRMAEDVYQ